MHVFGRLIIALMYKHNLFVPFVRQLESDELPELLWRQKKKQKNFHY